MKYQGYSIFYRVTAFIMAAVILLNTLDFIDIEYEEIGERENVISTITPIDNVDDEYKDCQLLASASKKSRKVNNFSDRAFQSTNICSMTVPECTIVEILSTQPQLVRGLCNIFCTYRI